MVDLSIPLADKVDKFILSKGVVKIQNGSFVSVHRAVLLCCSDLEIVTIYTAELRGKCNYYGMGRNFCRLSYFAYLMEYSCLKTLASKHKCSIGKVKWMFKDGKGRWGGVLYETREGSKRMYFARYQYSKNVKDPDDVITTVLLIHGFSTMTFESRLKAGVCEFCGVSGSSCFEVHHVNKVKNLKEKDSWERVMVAKRRKTLVVCRACHYKIHNP